MKIIFIYTNIINYYYFVLKNTPYLYEYNALIVARNFIYFVF